MNKQEFTKQIVIALAGMTPNNPLACLNTAQNFANEAESRGLFEEDCPERNETPAVALLRRIDWEVLRMQKECLYKTRVNCETSRAYFTGILNFLTEIQHTAVAEGATEAEVFGEQA